MKKKLFPLLLVLTAKCSLGQNRTQTPTSFSEMNECEFFTNLETFKTNGYNNQTYLAVKADLSLRTDLLEKLESYLIVFHNDSIAPMYLDETADPRACSTYVQAYNRVHDLLKVQAARDSVQKGKFQNIRFLLIDLTDLNRSDNSMVETYLAEFKHSFTLQYLYYDIKKAYFDNIPSNPLNRLPQLVKERNIQLLASRMNNLDNKIFTYYQHYNSKPHFIKAYEMYHENDVFILAPGLHMNQDRELTGGFKFTIVTDYLKWRWLRVGNKKQDNILTYQTLSLLGGGYTPYIRYRNNYSLADSLYKYDRPFASFLCFERAKHRTWRNGLIRHRGEFQVGSLGISQGRKIQAKLHEDVIHSSQFVHGWDKQIADGGRLIIQLNHKFDFLLYSNTNRYKTIIYPFHYKVDEIKKYGGCNIIGEIDIKTGTIMTTAGAGIRFSTLDFLKQSGNQMIMSRDNSKDAFGWKFDIGLNYRYVVHNSLLEGLGWLKTFPEDQYDKVLLDNYVLKKNDIERNMFILDYGLSLKWRKTTVFFRQNFHTLEYRSSLSDVDFNSTNLNALIDSEDKGFYANKVIKEQKSFLNNKVLGKQIYGYGILGISWIIE